ncbi:TMP-TENI-domain-containing protein [Annulohypoxylon nitens]|nr:TMP-TENI-domain-containing protein [Annulohypoxylon nitens]
MPKPDVDYTLYLVTDSSPAYLRGRDIGDVVEDALKGGVTVVQYRDKTSDTGVLVSTARKLHEITKRYKVPLLINDRVDVALVVGCEGVHIGQDDLDLASARKLLGEDAIIGVTVSNWTEIQAAVKGGADYLGIGTIYATPTKKDTKNIIGIDGLRELLLGLATERWPIKTVCIGGINESNVARVVSQSENNDRSVDGVAIVSAIMAAETPEAAASRLANLVKTSKTSFANTLPTPKLQRRTPRELIELVPDVIKAVHTKKPLSHNMTNLVVQNFAANVALGVGASPIMANYGEEARDLAKLGGALVINMGTVTPEGLENYLKALKAYNDAGLPVVFDPVGAGATAVRRSAVKTILNAGYVDVLKGNRSEIMSLRAGNENTQQRGVDSHSESDWTLGYLKDTVQALARFRKHIVVMTGEIDIISAGERVYTVENGHEYLGEVTGTGCCLGTAISAMVAAYPDDKLGAVVAALLFYNIAAEIAAERPDVKGPGTFVPAFIDELHNLRKATVGGDIEWLKRADMTVEL